ncbi:MAG TPA: XRE family transcriptional regulator [Candidatus Eisenbacteria bacterium]|nr:XRE family transcriptional regulator [Candidatus Eisenbacteria bacterium]
MAHLHPGAESRRKAALSPRDPSPRELGRRIKLLRISRGLTLKDLEARGGISATHVSEIERGKASPTVGALGRIARALGLRPATLVEPAVLPDVSVTRAGERDGTRVQIGAAIVEPMAEPVENAVLSGHVVTLPIGREPAFTHRHEGEEWATVVSGVAEICVDGEAHVLREGDSLHFRAHVPHSYANLASSAAVLIVACRPRLAL